MLVYKGDISELEKEISEYDSRLEKTYSSVFSYSDFSRLKQRVRQLLSAKSFLKSNVGSTYIMDNDKRLNPSIEELASNPFFSMLSLLVNAEELYVIELDRRILQNLGFNPCPWMNGHAENQDDNLVSRLMDYNQRKRNSYGKMADSQFIEELRNWQRNYYAFDDLSRKFLESYSKCKVEKYNAEFLEQRGLLDFDNMMSIVAGMPDDSYFACGIVSPEIEQLKLKHDGGLRGAKKLITVPMLRITKESADIHSEETSGMPKFLVPYIHEFNHLLLYILQPHPMVAASNILRINFEFGQ